MTDLATALAQSFDLIPTNRPSPETLAAMATDGFLVLFTRDASWRLRAKPGRFDGTRARWGLVGEQLADVPVAVSYQHGLEEAMLGWRAGRPRRRF